MYDFDGLRLSYKPAPETEMEKNLFDLKDKQGNFLVQDMIEIAKKGGGYTTYYWDNPATGNVEAKGRLLRSLEHRWLLYVFTE